ncbi:uncharacterized protein CTHT_0001370 [Thermochaetoides thermophila DSM 1495]|uniref:Aminoglycoside phosphotransferase domain-containing protein n=1 Tax=Chaetomium thermophilum (strain DSM 1495 / CBS 144.50 / IMI 039719) TaxID=759272 RepID=G0RZ16_CHATD|nr:hypothetical protein CTHT_0001370 [Thermochaetoides thermophila DSM 1495]EGS23444.1 hypothetical protein CTHT_0001370 [Thermochaetoides thermophila DSM 1495]
MAPHGVRFPIRMSPCRPREVTSTDYHRYWRSHEEEGYLERYWPDQLDHEAWIPIIRKMLVQRFPAMANANITYFAKGTFNRLYSITMPNWDKKYIFRVSIPVEPFFKTESEVATMVYVYKNTTIPIPRVVAFSSSDDNELGYEWILMEMLDGVPLRTVWPDMDFAARCRLFREIAYHAKSLLRLRFSKFGNIYFSEVAEYVNAMDCPANNEGMDTDLGPNGPFVLGRIVSQDFFFEKRVNYPASRGPFLTTRELVEERVKLLEKRIQDLAPEPGTPFYCENDRELARYQPLVQDLFDQLKALVPRLVPHDNGPEDVGVLWHDDLSEHNLIVDPITYKLVGIVDWESVSILPAYETYGGLPVWISDRDWRPTPLVLLSRGVPPNDEIIAAQKRQRELELGPIRREYYRIVGPLYDATSLETQQRVKNKQGLAKQLEIASFQHRPWATAMWLVENGYARDPKLAEGIRTLISGAITPVEGATKLADDAAADAKVEDTEVVA